MTETSQSDIPNPVIWSSRLDDTYDVRVERISECIGKLVIECEGQPIGNAEVSISYRATFGPDVADVVEWQNVACAIVDGRHTPAIEAAAALQSKDSAHG